MSAILKKQLTDLGVNIRTLNYNTIRDQLGIHIYKADKRYKSGKKELRWGAKGYENELVSRVASLWHEKNNRFVADYTINFNVRFKRTHKVMKEKHRFQLTGKLGNLNRMAEEYTANWIAKTEVVSPYEWIGDFEMEETSRTKIPITSGGRIIHTNIKIARMREARALMLDVNYTGNMDWDRQQGTCVFDYLYHIYAPLKGFVKEFTGTKTKKISREECYENIAEVLTDSTEEVDLLSDGVNINNLKNFCRHYKLSMYVYDKEEELIEHYTAEEKNCFPPIIFIIANNHFYPIELSSKRKSFIAKQNTKNNTNWNSEVVADPLYAKSVIENVYHNDDGEDPNEWAINKIYEVGTQPKANNIYLEGLHITKFKIGKDVYITEPFNPDIRDLCKINNMDYQGQSFGTIATDTWNESMETTDGLQICSSTFSPQVYEELNKQGVKSLIHYGATKDLTEYLELIPQPDVITYEEVIEEVKIEAPLGKYFEGVSNTKINKYVKTTITPSPAKRLIDIELENGTTKVWDCKKCYASCIKYPLDEFLCYGMEDTIEEFKGEIKLGLYFVETDDTTLFNKSRWYDNRTIELALQEGINFVVIKQLIPKQQTHKTKPVNYFEAFIQKAIDLFEGDENKAKHIINALIGLIGKTKYTKRIRSCDTDIERVWEYFYKAQKPEDNEDKKKFFYQDYYEEIEFSRFGMKDMRVSSLKTKEGKSLHIFGFDKEEQLETNCLPIYLQILCWANIKLYNAGKQTGGEVIFRKTDAIAVRNGKDLPLLNQWGTFKEELNTSYHYETMERSTSLSTPIFRNRWIHHEQYTDSGQYKEYLKLGSLLITGDAGTGKTYGVKEQFKIEDIMDTSEWTNEDTARCAFTNKSARNFDGTTIHKLLKLGNKNGKLYIPTKMMSGLRKLKRIVVDEISMVGTELWRLFIAIKRKYPHIDFILIGDEKQIPPIEEYDINYFHHPAVKYLTNFNKIELTKIQRYDMKLYKFVMDMYHKDIIGNNINEEKIQVKDMIDSVNICYYNATRRFINKECMNYMKDKTESLFIPHTRINKEDKADDIYIYKNLPVMCMRNCEELEITNGSEFKVESFDATKVYMTEGISIDKDEFHKYFVSAYCITAHKSQSSTFDKRVNIFNWDRIKENRKICYTALTRATLLNNLYLNNEWQ